MTMAYLLINSELGSDVEIISILRSIDCVNEVNGVYGAYDILAKIESENYEKLTEVITTKIRKTTNVRSTLTLIEIEEQGKNYRTDVLGRTIWRIV